MKPVKALEEPVRRVKGVARMTKKKLTQTNRFLPESTQDASDRRTAQAGMGLQYVLSILIMLTMGCLIAGVFLSKRSFTVYAATPAQEDYDAIEAEHVEDGDETNEADETEVLREQTGISAEEAMAAAEAVNPGAKALEVELENENGVLVYEVEMDDGLEVMVDAANGNILGTEEEEAD